MTSTRQSRSVLITGATSGLGFETAAAVLRADPGSHIVVASRSRCRGEQAARRLADRAPHRVSAIELDLASLASVRVAVARLRASVASGELPSLGGVVANAAVQMRDARQRTVDGFEATFGTNVLGHFLLIGSLLPDLAPGARIVLVSSGTHRGTLLSNLGMPAPRWRAPEQLAEPDLAPEGATPRAGRAAYTTSKLAAVYLAHELARRPDTAGMAIACFDPGLMPATGLARNYGAAQRFMWHRVLPALRVLPGVMSPAASGRLLARLLSSPSFAHLRGDYVLLRRVTRSSPESYDPERETELWATAARLTGLSRESA
jgi:NAD(P)-dependent dehydrogenase (short-subunit alcohol dehydrogenase family)